MTKKEIYSEIVNIQQKLLSEFNYNFPINTRNVSNYLTRTTKEELEHDLSTLESLYEKKCLEKKANEYFATDEGKVEFDRINKRLEELEIDKEELINTTTAELDKLIKNNYGNWWGVCVHQHSVEVRMMDDDGNPLFGCGFSISWYDDDIVTLNFSCGAFNSFEIESSCLQHEVIEVMYDFLHSRSFNTGVYGQLKAIICQFAKLNQSIKKEIDDLEELKSNPFVKK